MSFLLLLLPNKRFPDEPIKVCIFSCKVELNNFFLILFPHVGSDEYKDSLLALSFCSVVSVVFLLKLKNSAVKWELFFRFFFYDKSSGGGTLCLLSICLLIFFSPEPVNPIRMQPLSSLISPTKVDGLPACKLPIR